MTWSWDEIGEGRMDLGEMGEEKGWIGSKPYAGMTFEDDKTILKTEFGEYTEACSNSHNWFIVKSNYYENSSLNSRNSVSLAVPLIWS